MRDSQKVYIKGDSSRGDEVIKTLIGLGGINLNNLDGKGEDTYYYISPSGIIIGVASYEKNMMSILKEFYKEIQLPRWKPKYKERYYRINWKGVVIETTWYDTQDERICYEFGNCFKTYEEAKEARRKIKELLNKLYVNTNIRHKSNSRLYSSCNLLLSLEQINGITMITLKYWNSLSTDCRKAIVRIISNDSDHDNEIIQPYHHSFDYDITGKKLKAYLSRVFLTKGGKLKIFTELLPTFSPSDDTIKKVQKKQVKNNYPVAHKYYFRMYTKSDPEDGETIWEMAYSEAEARDKAYSDFHSIVELDLIKVV